MASLVVLVQALGGLGVAQYALIAVLVVFALEEMESRCRDA